jgi:hypothetical protein
MSKLTLKNKTPKGPVILKFLLPVVILMTTWLHGFSKSNSAIFQVPSQWEYLDGGPNDPREVGGLDYWIICDNQRAYLFFTSLNGKLWRLWTKLEDFPHGFDHCEIALEAEIYEASHTYRLKGQDRFMTFIEEKGQRYFKAYLADRLDGEWTPVADSFEKPFAGIQNVRPSKGVAPWTDNISHGELVRDGFDQSLTIDPNHLELLFQGMFQLDKENLNYGQFAWRLGLLTPISR